MRAKDLKPGDVFWGFPMLRSEEYEELFLNCYQVKSIKRQNDLIVVDYIPIVHTDDTGFIAFPKELNMAEPIFICYNPGCIFCYCGIEDRIIKLYKLCVKKKFKFAEERGFDPFFNKWGNIKKAYGKYDLILDDND